MAPGVDASWRGLTLEKWLSLQGREQYFHFFNKLRWFFARSSTGKERVALPKAVAELVVRGTPWRQWPREPLIKARPMGRPATSALY